VVLPFIGLGKAIFFILIFGKYLKIDILILIKTKKAFYTKASLASLKMTIKTY